MAVYLYACTSETCDHEEEVKHSMKDSPDIHCKKCDTIMKRKLSAGYTGVSCKYFPGNNAEYYGDGRH
jgi:predicted nucleic acid-binding Zn ribbon protein